MRLTDCVACLNDLIEGLGHEYHSNNGSDTAASNSQQKPMIQS